jgi:hypothetical protein
MRALLAFLSFFVWLVVPLALYGGYRLYGLPHVIWSYEYESAGGKSRWDFEGRWYESCTFVGPHGTFTVPADHGRWCGVIAFFHAKEAAQ